MMKFFSKILLVCLSVGLMGQPVRASQSGIVGRAKEFIHQMPTPQVKFPDWRVVERAQRIVDSLPSINVDPRLSRAAGAFTQSFNHFKACVSRKGECSTAKKGVIRTAAAVVAYLLIVGAIVVGGKTKEKVGKKRLQPALQEEKTLHAEIANLTKQQGGNTFPIFSNLRMQWGQPSYYLYEALYKINVMRKPEDRITALQDLKRMIKAQLAVQKEMKKEEIFETPYE